VGRRWPYRTSPRGAAYLFHFGAPALPVLPRILGACAFILPLAAVAFLWRQRSLPAGTKNWFYLTTIMVLWLIVVGAWGWSCVFNIGAEGSAAHPAALLFRFRALDLYSGTSPALPFLVLGIVGLSGFLLYLKRFTRAGFGRPCLILAVFDKIPLNQHYRAVNGHIVAPSHLSVPEWSRRMLVSTAALVVCLPVLQLTRYAAAFENPVYNLALACAVAMLLFSLATTCYDLVLVSRHLQRLLALVDYLPLRESFKQITRDLPHRPVWSQRLSKHLIAKQMMIALHTRRLVRGDEDAEGDFNKFRDTVPAILGRGSRVIPREPASQLIVALQPSGSGGAAVVPARAPLSQTAGQAGAQPGEEPKLTIHGFLQDRRAYEKLCAQLATKIIVNDLRPIWAKGTAESKGELTGVLPGEQREWALCKCCSDFVALQFSRYLIYAVGPRQGSAAR